MTTSPPTPEALRIAGPAGVLEALLESPALTEVREFAVVCHPHPQHGGTMHNKVAHMLARSCQDCQMPTLRFNFRGVGASAGSFADGVGETDDALAIIAAGRQRWPDARLTLAGFSFGAAVALRAAVMVHPARLITVAPAVDRVVVESLPGAEIDWLLLQGDSDEVVSPTAVQNWLQSLQYPPKVVWLPGVGHFFHGALNALRDQVVEFLRADAGQIRAP